MRFINDHGVVSAVRLINLLIDHRELLQGGNDNPRACVDGVEQVAAGFLLADGFYRSERMVKARDGVL